MKRPKVTDKRILRLYEETGSITKVSKQVGRSYMAIWLRLEKLGKK